MKLSEITGAPLISIIGFGTAMLAFSFKRVDSIQKLIVGRVLYGAEECAVLKRAGQNVLSVKRWMSLLIKLPTLILMALLTGALALLLFKRG